MIGLNNEIGEDNQTSEMASDEIGQQSNSARGLIDREKELNLFYE